MSHSVKFDEHGRKGGETKKGPELSSDNHAFYIGKLIPDTAYEKISKILGWGKAKDRIYNEEFITGALDYLFAHLKSGEKARFIVCRSVSEIINGREDVEKAISTEKEIELIKRIAEKNFGKGDKELEVLDIEKMPRHEELFEALRNAIDPETGKLDIEKALSENGREKVIVETSSLQIAGRLYKAAQASETLSEAFEKAMPARIKEEKTEGNSTSKYYALIETAVRLGDILNGQYIHGGAERQAVYNGIVINLIKGEKGRYGNIKELKPLFDELKNRRFETLALDGEKNYFQLKKIQNAARYRLLIYAAFFASAISGAFGAGRMAERKQAEEREADIKKNIVGEKLKNMSFYFEGQFKIAPEHLPGIFKATVEKGIKYMTDRYILDEETAKELAPFFQSYILRNSNFFQTIHDNNFALFDHVDLFVKENGIYFKTKGISAEGPYHGLQKKLPLMKELIQHGEAAVNDYDVDWGNPLNMEYIGSFESAATNNSRFEFYIYTKPGGKKYLVARDFELEKPGTKYFSTKQAKLGLWQFEYAMKRHNLLQLYEFNGSLILLHKPVDFQKRACSREKISNIQSSKNAFHTLEFRDSESRGKYDVMKYPARGPKENPDVDCILAAARNDADFSFKRGQEVIKKYYAAMADKWYDYYLNRMEEEKDSGK